MCLLSVSDANYRATLVILNDIESHGLVQFNEQYCDEEFFKNFLEFEKDFSNSFHNIARSLGSQNQETMVFAIYSEMSFIMSHLDVINKFLKIIVNPAKLKGGFNENTSLYQMVTKICNKMQYSEKLKNSIRGMFLLGFRNAITTQQYRIYQNDDLVIFPNDENLKKHFSIKDLTDYSLQVISMLEAMIDWSNGGKKSVDNSTNALYSLVDDMKRQVELLDKKLDRLC